MYTVKHVSKIFNVSEETVRRWIRDGKLNATISSKKAGYRIGKEDMKVFAESRPKYKKLLEDFLAAKKEMLTKKLKAAMKALPYLLAYAQMQNYIKEKLRAEA